MTHNMPPVHQLYSKYLYSSKMQESKEENYVRELWESIPTTIGQAVKLLSKRKPELETETEQLETLKKKMKNDLKKRGLLTESTKEKIDYMHLGVVETGQQPNCLGGPSLVLNKAIYMRKISELSGTSPFFNVVDYDGVQPELTKTRFPSLSTQGLQISYPTTQGEENIPIYRLKNPSETWLETTIEKIKNNYKGLLKAVVKKEKYVQNLEQVFTIIKNAYYSTENVSELSTKILGTILNIESNQGIPIYSYSMSETNQLFQDGYETLLSEPNRTRFIEASNQAVETIIEAGHMPQVGHRSKDYVPFYMECSDCFSRVKLKYEGNANSSTATIKGNCPKCGTAHVFSFNAHSPDLTEVIGKISPCVDSRQFIIRTVVPILARVGGPAETAYFAELIPVAKALDTPFPFIMRYTRIFYNTPWNELLGETIEDEGYTPILNNMMFNALGKWVSSRNEEDEKGFESAHKRIQYSISRSYQDLLKKHQDLAAEIVNKKRGLDSNQDPTLLCEVKKLNKTLRDIELYLSWAYGRYNPNKFGQEVNWNWIDLAIVTGIKDITGIFERLYNEHTPNSSVFFVNL